MSNNYAKAASFAFAFDRMKEAMAAEWYLEVIALCESIMSDRIWSHVEAFHSDKPHSNNFGRLIGQWLECSADRSWPKLGDLGTAARLWAGDRNDALHGAAKAAPGSPTTSPADFMAKARDTAQQGMVLARAIADWDRKQPRGPGP